MPCTERTRAVSADEVKALLRSAGLRVTAARVHVLEALLCVGRPLAHAEVVEEVRKQADGGAQPLDRVTVYRTLTALARTRLVHKVLGMDGVLRFGAHLGEKGIGEKGRCGGNHIHFVCVRCGAMTCLQEQPLPWVEPPKGGEIYGKQLLVYGRCAACASLEGQKRG